MAKLEQLLAAIESPRLYERHVGDASAGVGYLIDTLGPSLFRAR